MSFDASYFGSEIQRPLTLLNVTNISVDEVMNNMESICKGSGIPANFEKNSVVSGGFLSKKTYECIVVRHPEPPQDYCAQIYTFAGNTITFNFIGNSKAMREKNEYDEVMAGGGTAIQRTKYMFKKPDNIALQQEMGWHASVIGVFNSLIK